ncbi:MAG: tyrosine-type recombinase/integrase [Pseudonocardiaceae bacterium]|nr:tyrosine-type recombinase/integrase [Pseudonocardiaceae bacterium]
MAKGKKNQDGRAANGTGSFYYSEQDGYWHGWVVVGTLDNGKPDRRHVMRRDEGEAWEGFLKLIQARDTGTVRKASQQRWTVETWLEHWLANIAPLTTRYKGLVGYKTAVRRHLIPGLGGHRLERVEPDKFEKLYAKMLASGLKPGTVHQVHRTARTAFGEAERRQLIFRNPLRIAKAPRVDEEEVEPLDAGEIQRVLAAALRRRNGVRFVIALALGARQGESLAIKWSRLDEQAGILRVRTQLQRRTWEHGCSDPHKCGEKYHKVESCPKKCKRHKRPCPPPCPKDCIGHARMCPQRTGGGLVEVPVKSKAGRRKFAVPAELLDLLHKHREQQNAEREQAGSEWQEEGWIFTQPNGKPIDPRRDYDEWVDLLNQAEVRKARLHDARHTAATVLLILGVADRTVMDIMGWSSLSMKQRYMHVTDDIRNEVAEQLNGYFWKTP